MRVVFYALAFFLTLVVAGASYLFYAQASLETPDHTVVEADGAFEIRDYRGFLVAEVARPGDRETAVRSGFRALAGYIFAREREGERIAMTAPVIQAAPSEATDPGLWRVAFVMPSGRTAADLPAPARDDLRFKQVPGGRYAAVRFSGSWTDELFAERESALRRWAAARGLSIEEPAMIAYYNDPFTPGFLRRNEVLLKLR